MAGILTMTPAGVMIAVRVQPRASHTKVVGVHAAALKIATTAPPVEGAANQAICRLLAAEFGVANGAVTIVSGEKGRDKRVLVTGVSSATAAEFLRRWGGDGNSP